MKLKQLATERGAKNQPGPQETSFDSVEMQVIDEVETLRRRGLQQFEDHLRVYRERLSRATEVRKEVEIVAGNARTDFIAEVETWKAHFSNPVEKLKESFDWRQTFRQRHRLMRPAVEFSGWPKTIAIGMLLLLIETVLNGYLFAQNNVLGMLGGILAALLVSISNVGVSSLAGYFSRYLNHRNLLWKLLGLLVLVFWICYAAGFNLAVAHFRDGVEQTGDWTFAAENALETLTTEPLGIASIESWLLVLIGVLISLLAFLKGLHTDDPYPGYGKVSRAVLAAREAYASELEAAIGELEHKRDAAIDELRDAHDEVRQGIGEAVDALFGQSSLRSQLSSFLEQCDVKVGRLLSIYRDANNEARQEASPPSFSKQYSFAAFKFPNEEKGRKLNAEKEAAKVGDLVDATIREIFEAFEVSVGTYREIDEIQGTESYKARRAQAEEPKRETMQ
ncbi:hypothetical protein [Marivivens marinus]|uniref:hypothetical protein n=1 Tax=Marivivens marinus TaxID=3110173 RepID=UPI003B84A670